MPFGLFGEFGFFEFGGPDKTTADSLYDTQVESLEGAFDMSPGSYEEARAYARAMLFGEARTTLRRAWNQLQPSTVSDKLAEMEADYKIVPAYGDSNDTRRARLVARKLLMSGGRLEALWTALQADLGDDFIALRPTRASEQQAYPPDPSIVGTFPSPSHVPRFYKLIDPVWRLDIALPVRMRPLNASDPPLAGEKLTIEPEILGNAEAIKIASVVPEIVAGSASGNVMITPAAPFAKSHSRGAAIVTASPLWHSNQREIRVVMSDAATRDPEKRRKAHVIMNRHSKAVTRWRLVAASGAGSVGPFVIGAGHNVIHATALGAAPGTF